MASETHLHSMIGQMTALLTQISQKLSTTDPTGTDNCEQEGGRNTGVGEQQAGQTVDSIPGQATHQADQLPTASETENAALAEKTEVAAAKTNVAAKKSALTAKKSALTAKKSSLTAKKSEVAQKKSDVSAMKSDVASKKSDVTAKKSEGAAKKSDVTAKKSDVTAKKSDGAAKKSDVTAMKSDVTAKKSDVTAMKSDVTSKKSDVTAKKSDVTEMKSDVTAKKSEGAAKKSDVTAMKSDVAEEKSDVSSKKSDVSETEPDGTVKKSDVGNENSDRLQNTEVALNLHLQKTPETSQYSEQEPGYEESLDNDVAMNSHAMGKVGCATKTDCKGKRPYKAAEKNRVARTTGPRKNKIGLVRRVQRKPKDAQEKTDVMPQPDLSQLKAALEQHELRQQDPNAEANAETARPSAVPRPPSPADSDVIEIKSGPTTPIPRSKSPTPEAEARENFFDRWPSLTNLSTTDRQGQQEREVGQAVPVEPAKDIGLLENVQPPACRHRRSKEISDNTVIASPFTVDIFHNAVVGPIQDVSTLMTCRMKQENHEKTFKSLETSQSMVPQGAAETNLMLIQVARRIAGLDPRNTSLQQHHNIITECLVLLGTTIRELMQQQQTLDVPRELEQQQIAKPNKENIKQNELQAQKEHQLQGQEGSVNEREQRKRLYNANTAAKFQGMECEKPSKPNTLCSGSDLSRSTSSCGSESTEDSESRRSRSRKRQKYVTDRYPGNEQQRKTPNGQIFEQSTPFKTLPLKKPTISQAPIQITDTETIALP